MKIPKQAKKVFKGEIFDVYHWQQKMYDGSFATFEMLKRPNAVRVIATADNKIFLNKEEQPGTRRALGTFGGRMDPGETPLQCAKRELLEEAGMISKDWELLKIYEPYSEKMDFYIYLYLARNCRKIKEPNLDSGEKISVKEVSFEEFIKIILGEKSIISKELAFEILLLKDQDKLKQFKKKLFKTKK